MCSCHSGYRASCYQCRFNYLPLLPHASALTSCPLNDNCRFRPALHNRILHPSSLEFQVVRPLAYRQTSQKKEETPAVSRGRHEYNCSVCSHLQREDIERDFVNWVSPATIAK